MDQWPFQAAYEYKLTRHQSRNLYRMVPTSSYPVSTLGYPMTMTCTDDQVVHVCSGQARFLRFVRYPRIVSLLLNLGDHAQLQFPRNTPSSRLGVRRDCEGPSAQWEMLRSADVPD